MDQPGQYPAEIGIVVEGRRQHRKGCFGLGAWRRDMCQDQLEERRQVLARPIEIGGRPAVAARCEEGREIELRLARVEGGEEVEDLVVDLARPGVGPVDLVDYDDRPQALAQGL